MTSLRRRRPELGLHERGPRLPLSQGTDEEDAVTDRVLIQDVVPYELPSSLDELRGPGSGVLKIPQSVHWGPDSGADLSTRDGVQKAYGSLIREGSAAQQEQLLNRGVLLRAWSELRLPQRCRALWEAQFPELLGADDVEA